MHLMRDMLEANDYFNQVIKTSPDKDLVANASIYRAQNYADLGQSDKAIAEFKSLGNTYKRNRLC